MGEGRDGRSPWPGAPVDPGGGPGRGGRGDAGLSAADPHALVGQGRSSPSTSKSSSKPPSNVAANGGPSAVLRWAHRDWGRPRWPGSWLPRWAWGSVSPPVRCYPVHADLAALLTDLQEGDVLFIDEIHRLHRAVEEILYPAMEDFKLDILIGKGPTARSIRLDLPRFTLIGATTRTGLVAGP